MAVLALTVKIRKSCSFEGCHLEVKLNHKFGFLRNWKSLTSLHPVLEVTSIYIYASIYSQQQPMYPLIFSYQQDLVIIDLSVNELHDSYMTNCMHQNIIKCIPYSFKTLRSRSVLQKVKFKRTRELFIVL